VNRGALYYMMLPLIGAACLFQTTAAARIKIYDVKPDLVLLLVVMGTLVYGGRPGLVWAFFGGLGLDIFSGGPMGSSSLALMAAALVASFGHRTLSRFNVFVPLVGMVAGTLAYAGAYMGILGVLQYLDVTQHQMPVLATVQNVVLPAVVYNTTLMVLLIPFLNRIPESQDL
jgi:rod shape-determining protein MreD